MVIIISITIAFLPSCVYDYLCYPCLVTDKLHRNAHFHIIAVLCKNGGYRSRIKAVPADRFKLICIMDTKNRREAFIIPSLRLL